VLPSDKEAFRYLSEYKAELDLISGKHCFVIILGSSDDKYFELGNRDWNATIKEHFSLGLSVKIASLFDITFIDFPCFLLFQDIRSADHVVVKLKGMSADDIADKLRLVFSIVYSAEAKKETPLAALEQQRNNEKLQVLGQSVVSEIRTFAGKTFELVMDTWVKEIIKS
jgi:hypothetical protein